MPHLTTTSIKHAGLFDTPTAAERAREAYIAACPIRYGKRVWFQRAVQEPVYYGRHGGWIVPVVLIASGRTVYLTGEEL